MSKRILNLIILLVTTLVSGYFVFSPGGYTDVVVRAQSGPDLTIEAISSSPEAPAIGDEITFTVTLRNQGAATSGAFYVAYYLDDDYLTRDYVASIEAGASAEHTFTWTAEAGIHTVRAVADYKQQVNETDEDNNAKTYTFSTLGPDLLIDSISWSPSWPSVGSSVTFTVTIKNLGALIANTSRVHFYIDGVSRGYKDVGRINAGETVTRTFSWFTKAGAHDIRAVIDQANAVPEMNEDNNEKTALFSPLLPDLIIEDIIWEPSGPSIGDNISFTVTVANQGVGVAGNSTVHFYVSENHLDSEPVDALDPGAAENVTFSWVIGYVPRNVKAVVSSIGMFTESDESNNEKTILLSPLLPDLLIQDITWSPVNPAAGENVTFAVPILNQGTGNSIPCRIELIIDNERINYHELGPIDASGGRTHSFDWIVKGGVHKVQAIVDSQHKMPETIETNNEKVITFPTQPPDLTIEQITWTPLDPAIGDKVTITVAVHNQGEAVSDYTYILYYIDDVEVASGQVEPVSYNTTDNQTFTWTVTAGEHVIKAFVDPTDIIDESDETNNEGSTTMTPTGPDLIIESIDWSRNNPQAGEMVTFTITAKNNGDVTSSTSLVHLDVDNSSRGYQAIPKLEPGAKVTKTFDWKFVPGLHDIRAFTDGPNLVVETNEQNNEMLITYPIPDLTFEALTLSPVEPAMGDKVTLTAHVQNAGSLDADGFQLHFYVDDNIEDQRDIPPLAAGTSVIETFEWDVTYGPHILTVLADGAKAITEQTEDNNEGTVNFTVLAPDLIIESITWPTGEPSTGDNVTFTITIRNQGDGQSEFGYVSYFVDGDYLESGQIKSLKPGAKTEVLFSALMSQTGAHTISLVVDEGNRVPESDETNNEETIAITTESITTPAPAEKPEPKPQVTTPMPLLPEMADNMVLIFFAVVILVFVATLVLSVLREFRKRNE
jgi:subtilase family serine protease